MKNMADQYRIVVRWSDEDEEYVATCPAFSGLSAGGDTPAEAVQDARLILEDMIEIHQAHGDPLPQPDYELV